MKKYYEILGLDKGASKKDIQDYYDKLSIELDPKNNDDLDFFKEEYALLQNAYKKLMGPDPDTKKGESLQKTLIEVEQKIEITETDIILYPNLRADSISVFNIKIGMNKKNVQYILQQDSNLYSDIDCGHNTNEFRMYVYDKDGNNSKRNCILYLIWNNHDELSKITFFEDFARYLKGDTKKLLTFEGFDSKSKLCQEYLGYPNKKDVTLDVPSIKLKHTTYYFYSKGIEITIKKSKVHLTAVFAFILNEKK